MAIAASEAAFVRPLVRREAATVGIDTSRSRPYRVLPQETTWETQSRRNALRALHTAGDNAGLNPKGAEKVGLHDLRHSLAAAVLEEGGSLAEVAAALRHKNARVSAQVYPGLTDGGREKTFTRLAEGGLGA